MDQIGFLRYVLDIKSTKGNEKFLIEWEPTPPDICTTKTWEPFKNIKKNYQTDAKVKSWVDTLRSGRIPDFTDSESSESETPENTLNIVPTATEIRQQHDFYLDPKKRNSAVWKTWRFVNEKEVICLHPNPLNYPNTCNQTIPWSGNTSNMITHNKKYHQTLNTAQKLDDWVQKSTAGYEKVLFVLWMLESNRPFNTAQDRYLNMLLNHLRRTWNTPCYLTLCKVRDIIYSETKILLKQFIQEQCKYGCLVADTWTNRSLIAFMGIFIRFIDENWNIHSLVLDLKEKDPNLPIGACGIRVQVKQVTEEYSLQDAANMTFVSDSGPDYKKFSTKMFIGKNHLCTSHKLHNAVKDSFKRDTPALNLKKKCAATVTLFNRSEKKFNIYKSIRKDMNVPQIKFIQSNSTRWYSIGDMIKSVSEQNLSMKSYSKAHSLNSVQMDLSGKINKDLEYLKILAKLMEEESVTISRVYPTFVKLREYFSQRKYPFAQTLLERITHHFRSTFSPWVLATTLLDIRFKNSLGEEEYEVAVDFIKKELEASVVQPNQVAKVTSKKTDPLLGNIQTVEQSVPLSELDEYLNISEKREKEPLLWWKKNSKRYPKLADIARKLLAVPATSSLPERLFSVCGILYSTLRNRILAENAQKNIFINQNFVFLDERYKILQALSEKMNNI